MLCYLLEMAYLEASDRQHGKQASKEARDRDHTVRMSVQTPGKI